MNQEMEFKNIVAQYSKVAPEEMNNEMRFREDLGFSSLDFMSFLGELEDTFDLELDESEVLKITTLGEVKSAGRTSVIFFEAKLIKMSGSRIFCT
mgnify:CR=1 FL=1